MIAAETLKRYIHCLKELKKAYGVDDIQLPYQIIGELGSEFLNFLEVEAELEPDLEYIDPDDDFEWTERMFDREIESSQEIIDDYLQSDATNIGRQAFIKLWHYFWLLKTFIQFEDYQKLLDASLAVDVDKEGYAFFRELKDDEKRTEDELKTFIFDKIGFDFDKFFTDYIFLLSLNSLIEGRWGPVYMAV